MKRKPTGTKAFGDELHQRRKTLRLSQQEVGDKVGVGREAVGKWESGEVRPTDTNLARLEQHLKFDQRLAKALLDGTRLDELLLLIQSAKWPTIEERAVAYQGLSPAVQAVLDQYVSDRLAFLGWQRPGEVQPPDEDQT